MSCLIPIIQIGSYLGFPSFNNTFGNQVAADGTPSITAAWQAAGESLTHSR